VDDRETGSETTQQAVRARMADNADPRARRTRRLLLAAYDELVDEGVPVSASAVAKRAGVRRSTFYAHFAGVEDLAAETLTEVFDIVASWDSAGRSGGELSAYEVSENSLFEVIRFVDEHRAVYTDLLGQQSGFAVAAEDAFAQSALRTLLAGAARHGDASVTSRFIAAGAIGVIGWWLREQPALSARELAARLAAVIPTDFTSTSPDAGGATEEGAHDGQAQ
jgi:AcrR family transcriptional regulator